MYVCMYVYACLDFTNNIYTQIKRNQIYKSHILNL